MATACPPPPPARARRDRCPALSRPWPAEDGLLVRLRLVGGRVGVGALRALLDVAQRWGDGRVHLTGRANVQLRGLPRDPRAAGEQPVVHADVASEILATGLVPSRTHELVRNVMVSPQTGSFGGRADLRPVADRLDRALCADPRLAALPGRFLLVLDDGRGDLVDRSCDLGLVALDDRDGQLRVGDAWGPVVPLARAHENLVDHAREFLRVRGQGPDAPWHVAELPLPLARTEPPDPRVPEPCPPLGFGPVAGGRHVAVPGAALDHEVLREAVGTGTPASSVVVTPWRGLLVPDAATDARGAVGVGA